MLPPNSIPMIHCARKIIYCRYIYMYIIIYIYIYIYFFIAERCFQHVPRRVTGQPICCCSYEAEALRASTFGRLIHCAGEAEYLWLVLNLKFFLCSDFFSSQMSGVASNAEVGHQPRQQDQPWGAQCLERCGYLQPVGYDARQVEMNSSCCECLISHMTEKYCRWGVVHELRSNWVLS